MNIKTKVLGEYVNFFDNTRKQNKYLGKIMLPIAIILSSFLLYILFKYLNEQQFPSTTNTSNKSF